MKVITLWQPWATLMVIGAKTVETRPRNFNYKGELAIHAAKFKNDAFAELCKQEPFCQFIPDYYGLPFGSILGTVNVKGCCSTEWLIKNHELISSIKDWAIEKQFGNYTKGRSGIVTTDAMIFDIPTPAKGFQTMPWTFDESALLFTKL